MQSIELVSHCWSGDDVPIYHCLLQLQATSLLLSQHTVDVRYTVFYAEDDERTKRVIDLFQSRLRGRGIDFNPYVLPHGELFKRMLGRNLAALNTKADLIWFMDVDYLCLDKSLDQICEQADKHPEANLMHPFNIEVHKEHRLGDDLIAVVNDNLGAIIEINREDFKGHYCSYAFGGIQIGRGSWCRENGYINHREDWLEPLENPVHFMDTPSDRQFRIQCKPSVGLLVDGIYRIRHSRTGRDKGKVDHSKGRH